MDGFAVEAIFHGDFNVVWKQTTKKFNSFDPYKETKSTLDSFHALNSHENLENVYLLTRMGNDYI